MSQSPELTVVICTLNRRDSLLDSVASVAEDVEGLAAEIVVVDNGSTDDTFEVVSNLAGADPRIVAVRESRLGLSQARNTGAGIARGSVVAFIDDDAVVLRGWAAALLRGFENSPAVAVGGKSILDWPGGRRPKWLPKRYESLYSGVDYGEVATRLNPPHIPYGVNMAFRSDWLRELGGFDTRLGRKGESLVSCEEQDLFLRVRSAGGEIWYLPEAIVRHRVEMARARRKWMIRRAFAQGRTHGMAPHLQFTPPDGDGPEAGSRERPRLHYRLAVRAAYDFGKIVGARSPLGGAP